MDSESDDGRCRRSTGSLRCREAATAPEWKNCEEQLTELRIYRRTLDGGSGEKICPRGGSGEKIGREYLSDEGRIRKRKRGFDEREDCSERLKSREKKDEGKVSGGSGDKMGADEKKKCRQRERIAGERESSRDHGERLKSKDMDKKKVNSGLEDKRSDEKQKHLLKKKIVRRREDMDSGGWVNSREKSKEKSNMSDQNQTNGKRNIIVREKQVIESGERLKSREKDKKVNRGSEVESNDEKLKNGARKETAIKREDSDSGKRLKSRGKDKKKMTSRSERESSDAGQNQDMVKEQKHEKVTRLKLQFIFLLE